MAIEIVDLPIENGDFPVRYVSHYQRVRSHGIPLLLSTWLAIPSGKLL